MTKTQLVQNFINKWNGKRIDFDGYYGSQCVDLFNQYLVEVLDIKNPIQQFPVNSAFQIWDYGKDNPFFTRIENSPTAVPEEGDLVVWDKSNVLPHGHIAVFIKGDVMSFDSFDQNYPLGAASIRVTHNYTNPKVIGWLRPVKFSPVVEQPTNPNKPPFTDLIAAWNKLDGNKTYAAVLGMFLTIVAYNLGYITEAQFQMFDTFFLALMGFSLRDAIKKK